MRTTRSLAWRLGAAVFVSSAAVTTGAHAQDAQGINGNCNYPVNFNNHGTGARPGPTTLVPVVWGALPSDDVSQTEQEFDGVFSQIERSNYYRWLRNEYGAPQLQHVYPASTSTV